MWGVTKWDIIKAFILKYFMYIISIEAFVIGLLALLSSSVWIDLLVINISVVLVVFIGSYLYYKFQYGRR